MPTANTTVKSVRIDNDKLESLEKILCGKTINAWLNERIEEAVGLPVNERIASSTGLPDEYEKKYADLLKGSLSEELKAKTGFTSKYELSEEVLDDIGSMTTLSDMSVETAIEEFDRLLNEGALVIGDEINVELPSWTKRITEVCHDRCISVESMGKKIVEMIERGQI